MGFSGMVSWPSALLLQQCLSPTVQGLKHPLICGRVHIQWDVAESSIMVTLPLMCLGTQIIHKWPTIASICVQTFTIQTYSEGYVGIHPYSSTKQDEEGYGHDDFNVGDTVENGRQVRYCQSIFRLPEFNTPYKSIHISDCTIRVHL